MLFNSLEFAIFLPTVLAIFFSIPHRARTLFLLGASCYFYMAFVPAYILILFFTIVVDYSAGVYMEKTKGRSRFYVMWGSIIATAGVLFVFKYFNFFADSTKAITDFMGWPIDEFTINIILPIGLSFHTFQSLAYVVEVYHGKHKAEHNFITYAAYVMFFPQLVAGPIERPQNLLDQFALKHRFEYNNVTRGLRRIAWGFFKKLVVADRLALLVNDVYASPQDFNGLQLTLATVFFAYQIYCDFSGYSDIAIGTARIMGFRLMENFNTPYLSKSIPEFWRRWHISLSTWFRDYVYIPLGGSRVGKWKWCLVVLITFGISGLWHGAAWTYVVWGLLNGFYLIASRFSKGMRDATAKAIGLTETSPLRKAFQTSLTFFLVCVGWVIFRAESLADVTYIMTHFYSDWNFTQIGTEQFMLLQMPAAIASILVLEIGQRIHHTRPVPMRLCSVPRAVRWSCYLAFTLCVILFGIYQSSQFIYFQF